MVQQMMATAMLVIATAHSDNPYIFGRYDHLLIPERDAQTIADRLQDFTENPESLITVGMALREKTSEDFDVCVCATKLSHIYASLLWKFREGSADLIMGGSELRLGTVHLCGMNQKYTSGEGGCTILIPHLSIGSSGRGA